METTLICIVWQYDLVCYLNYFRFFFIILSF